MHWLSQPASIFRFPGPSLPWLVKKLKLSAIGPSTSQQELDARLALSEAANLHLDRNKSQGVPAAEMDYLGSHFRAQTDSWLMRLTCSTNPSWKANLSFFRRPLRESLLHYHIDCMSYFESRSSRSDSYKNWNAGSIWKNLVSNLSRTCIDC